MARWIVAGVLLAVLIALIVVDTSSLESGVASAPTAAAPAAGAAGAPAEGAAAPTEAAASPELAAIDERPKIEAACGKVKESIRAAKGDAYTVALGDAILVKVTEDEFAQACTDVAGLPVDQQIAKLEALAGGPPTVK